MTYVSKRDLRTTISKLEAELLAHREDGAESVQRVRDTIRVLNLTAYIEECGDGWGGTHTVYDVNQFLEDIEQGVKHLNEVDAQERYIDAIGRLKGITLNEGENA